MHALRNAGHLAQDAIELIAASVQPDRHARATPPTPTSSADSHSSVAAMRRRGRPSARSAATCPSRWFTDTVSSVATSRNANAERDRRQHERDLAEVGEAVLVQLRRRSARSKTRARRGAAPGSPRRPRPNRLGSRRDQHDIRLVVTSGRPRSIEARSVVTATGRSRRRLERELGDAHDAQRHGRQRGRTPQAAICAAAQTSQAQGSATRRAAGSR